MFTQNCPYKKRRTAYQHEKPTVRYQVQRLPNEIIVDLKKSVPKETIESAVLSHVRNFQDTIPRYKLVTDWFGNQYYVENDVDQQTIFNEVLRSIDWAQFGTNIGKKLFRDYDIQLNHDGRELRVASKTDGIDQIFELNNEVDDVEIIGLHLSEDLHDAVLKLRLVNKEITEEDVRSVQCGSSLISSKKLSPKYDAKSTHKTSRNKDSLKKKESHQHSKNKQKKDVKVNHSHDSGKADKQQLKSPVNDVKLAKPQQNISKITIKYASDDVGSTKETDNESVSTRRSSTSSEKSVTLEEVEDEEVKRWQQSLTQSPSGHSVLEDV